MKIVLTGSLGHISKPLAELLIAKAHTVTVITRSAARQKDIEALGATAAVGSLEDASFLSATFTGADVVYLMEPPFDFFNPTISPNDYWLKIANTYVQAVQNSGVTKVIHLSSIGAHTDKGVGILASHHYVENTLKSMPDTVSIKTMRPVGFYYNMFAFIPTIKTTNAIIQNYGSDEKEPWVSPLDIAETIADEIDKPFNGRTIRYIASDEVSMHEVAAILGNAIGKPDLKWVVISDEDYENNLLRAGFSKQVANGLTNMNAGRRNGLYDDYKRHKPVLGKVKVSDFAKDFARTFSQ